MKFWHPAATQGFRDSDEGVSPVIGVILMVAITVVLAGVVFVLVNGMDGGGTALPAIAFTVNNAGDRVTVQSTPNTDIQWSNMEVRMTADGAWGVNSEPVNEASANQWAPLEGDRVEGGDYIRFCADERGPMTVELRHTDMNTILRDFHFSSVRECPGP